MVLALWQQPMLPGLVGVAWRGGKNGWLVLIIKSAIAQSQVP